MKTMFLAAAAALSLGIGSAYAGEGEGTIANTQFTSIPGVVAQAPAQGGPVRSPRRRTGRWCRRMSPSRAAAPGCSRPTRTATANARQVVMRRGRHACRPFARVEGRVADDRPRHDGTPCALARSGGSRRATPSRRLASEASRSATLRAMWSNGGHTYQPKVANKLWHARSQRRPAIGLHVIGSPQATSCDRRSSWYRRNRKAVRNVRDQDIGPDRPITRGPEADRGSLRRHGRLQPPDRAWMTLERLNDCVRCGAS